MKHRTAIVTAASIAVVILAATAAIATNLKLLSSGSDTAEVGALTVDTTVSSIPQEVPPASIVKVEDEESSDVTVKAESTPAGEITAYAVGDAGVVTIENDGTMLTIGSVEPSSGWQTTQMLDGTSVDIGFVNADGQVLRFLAELDSSGMIQTVVEDLTPVASNGDSRSYDDDDKYENENDDKYENENENGYDDDDD